MNPSIDSAGSRRVSAAIDRCAHAGGMVLGLALAALAACGKPASPETEVRAVIAAGEAAIETRDLSAAMDLVAPEFRDADGHGVEETRDLLRAYLLTRQSLRLVTRIDDIDFPYDDMARVRMTVGSLARDSASDSLDLAAEVETFTLEFIDGDDGWRLTRAERGR